MNKIVRATAGAGKTTGLLEAVYQAYVKTFTEKGIYPKILLSTFTVKAANELTERLTKKAIEEGDSNFLNFVSSSYLEVGTLHSVFLKVFDRIRSENLDLKRKFNSKSYRQTVGRGILHKILREAGLESFLSEAREEKDLLDLYWHLYSYSYNVAAVFSENDLNDAIKDKLTELVSETEDKELAQKINAGFYDSNFILDWTAEKTSENPKLKKEYKKVIDFATDSINQPDFVAKAVSKNTEYLKVYNKWKSQVDSFFEKKEIFDVSDVEISLLNLLKKENFDEKIWDFCFFDEYQDTSPVQKEILDILSAKSLNYFVGDPFQSIYFFRGARKEIFLKEFLDVEKKGGATEYRLKNYRSAKDIVEFANGMTKSLVSDFMEMDPFHEDVEGGVKVAYFEEGDERTEFSYVANELNKIDLSKESAVVLSRGAKDLLKLAGALKAQAIPFRLALSKGFESSLEVIELSKLLKFQAQKEDDESFLALLFSYWVEIDDLEIQRAVESKKTEKTQMSLWSLLKDHPGLEQIVKFISNTESMSLSYALCDFLGESGFLEFSDELDPSGDREKNIIKFLGALSEEEFKENFSVESFCDDILKGLYRFESEDLSATTGCTLMTVHGSKGLQFDHVFLIGSNKARSGNTKNFFFDLNTNFFSLKIFDERANKFRHPYFVEEYVDSEKREIFEEKKRLLYVAMTRAQKSLHIIGSKKIPKVSKEPSWMKSALTFLEKNNLEEDLLITELNFALSDEKEAETHSLQGGFLKTEASFVFSEKDFVGVTQNLHDQSDHVGVERDLGFFAEAISQGVVFHELLEKAKSHEEALSFIEHYFEKNHDLHRASLDYLFTQSDFPFEEIFSIGFREWGFDTFGEQRRSGKIDLWARIGNTIWIVDYKTGSTANLEKGFEQISAYKKVIEDFLGESGLEFKLVLTFPYKKKTFINT